MIGRQEVFFKIVVKGFGGLVVDVVRVGAGKIGLLNGGVILLGVLSPDLVTEREEANGFGVSLALAIDRLGVDGLEGIAFGRIEVPGPGMGTPGVFGERK